MAARNSRKRRKSKHHDCFLGRCRCDVGQKRGLYRDPSATLYKRISLSVLDEEYRKTLSYLGSVSGRDEDKIAKSGLTVAHTDDVPYFAEANTVITGKKLYAQEYRPECFIDSSLDEKWYPQKDYHTMYILEIEKILVRE